MIRSDPCSTLTSVTEMLAGRRPVAASEVDFADVIDDMTAKRVRVDDIDRCDQALASLAFHLCRRPAGRARPGVVDIYGALTPIESANGGPHDR